MKRIIYILFIYTLIANFATAQESYDLKDIKRVNVQDEELPILIDGEWEWCSFTQANQLLNNDIYGFFKIYDVESDLEKRNFERSIEYQDSILPKFNQIRKDFLDTKYGILFNIKHNNTYDIEDDCFYFHIGFPNDASYQRPKKIYLGDNLCLTFPDKYLIFQQSNIGGRYAIRQFVKTPKVSEDVALDIERAMKKSDCTYSLLFVVKFDKALEKPSYFSHKWYYTVAKAIGLLVYDTETNKVVTNFDEIFKKPPTPTKKARSTTKRRTSTTNRTR